MPEIRSDNATIGRHHRQPQHVFAHDAEANGIGTAGARRDHAADRGIRAGIDGKEQTRVAHCLFSASRRTPASTRTIMSSGRISKIRSSLLVSSEMPPSTGMAPPSSPDPAPKGTIGTRYRLAIVAISATSSVEFGKTTISGWLAG